MKKIFHTIGLVVFAAFAAVSSGALASPTYAVDLSKACAEGDVKQSALCQGDVANENLKTGSFIKNLTDTLLFLLGTISVIMIIIGGIRYTTSNGDASQTKSAKDTIMYSVVGLVVALMAWGIVGFVINRF